MQVSQTQQPFRALSESPARIKGKSSKTFTEKVRDGTRFGPGFSKNSQIPYLNQSDRGRLKAQHFPLSSPALATGDNRAVH